MVAKGPIRAVVQDSYGPPDALAVRQIDKPTIRDDEVLVRVRAASVHPDVWHVVTGRPYVLRLMGAGLRRPRLRVPGTDLAGIVESVGGAVTRFRPGDAVFGETLRSMQWRNGGAFAEYASAPQDGLAAKPDNVSFEEAAAVPSSGLITLSNLPGADRLGPGRRVLVNGAAGGVGSIAVQLVKTYGAHVTGVDHTDKLDLVSALGADEVVDYTREDFTRSGVRYDLVFDVPGNHSFAECRRVLAADGTYVLIGHDHYRPARPWWGSLPRFVGLMARTPFTPQLPPLRRPTPPKAEMMAFLRDQLAAGTLRLPIDRTFPLDRAAEALRYLAEGKARGKVVLTV